MPEQPKFTESALRVYSEFLRRALYDATVAYLWTPLDPGDYVPSFTPDAAQLTVSFLGGRWIVAYLDLEEPADAPPDRRVVLSRILADPSKPFGVQLSEI